MIIINIIDNSVNIFLDKDDFQLILEPLGLRERGIYNVMKYGERYRVFIKHSVFLGRL